MECNWRIDGKIIFEDIAEYDTDLQTENREWLFHLTARGKKKKVTATNVLAVAPFGCEFYFTLDSGRVVSAHMGICNYRNNKKAMHCMAN